MFEGTIDWEAYWRGDVDAGALPVDSGDDEKRALLERFFERTTSPASFASVGCGAATFPAAIADRHPVMEVWGFDASKPIVDRNRAAYADRSNLSFGRASLPDPDVSRQFELVYCYGTLHYVVNTERAVEDLYSLVEPDGHLVVNYPNAGSREAHRENTEAGSAMYRRFRLVYHGENLLSRERISELLDGDVRDYWDYVDAPDTHWTMPGNPCVFVEKG